MDDQMTMALPAAQPLVTKSRMAGHILIVDDDSHIREVISFALEKAGMRTRAASNGTEALRSFSEVGADLIVLDINMPEMDGLAVCREVRKTSDVPILFLSSRDDEIDRILGLEIGGDDYVTKPFSPRELAARVNVILRRARGGPPEEAAEPTLRHGRLTLDPLGHQASWEGTTVPLTATEFSILRGFLRQPGRVFDRDGVILIAYGVNIHVSDRTIDSHIRNIRSKFREYGCEAVVETVHGVGYKLGACE
jgi:two-component system OmpR family response regulator